ETPGSSAGGRITAASQSAHRPASKEGRPDDPEVPSQVVPDVLTRRERASPAFFRRVKRVKRVKAGETSGSPRFHGANRYHSCTYQQFGNGTTMPPCISWRSVANDVGSGRPLEARTWPEGRASPEDSPAFMRESVN